jgi:hypothetical protein
MRLKIVAALVTAMVFAPAAGATGPTARTACTRGEPATIGGAHKCLQAGEYCATRYERQYERYGFVCSTRYRPPRLRRE